MTASLPQGLPGTQAPNALEILWERYKRLVQAAFWLLIVGMFAYYGLRYYEQTQANKKWSQWAEATLLRSAYNPKDGDPKSASSFEAVANLLDELRDAPEAHFTAALANADASQKPYVLWLKACREARNGDVDAASKTIDQLKAGYPNHSLVASTSYPVQVRQPVEKPKDKDKKQDAQQDEEEELKPALAGSPAEMLIQNLKSAKDFSAPPSFGKPAIPADAPRYKVTLEGEYGEFVIALMVQDAPKTCAKFDEIVTAKFWEGIKVDEIVRPSSRRNRFMEATRQFHFGFETTKTEANRADWDTSKPSKDEYTVQEFTNLSHFPGAVSARIRDGKSEVDRLYICESDSPSQDDQRMVFAYVVEGLENVRKICDASYDRSEDEEVGRGRPSENITIKSVTKL
jgi:cyclophilin family peptidyl-prolyl cis-trans isomerase